MAARRPLVLIDGVPTRLDPLNDTLDAKIDVSNVLNFTEAAQDAVAAALTSSQTIAFNYDDSLDQITSSIQPACIIDFHVNANAAIAWSKISKSGSNITDIPTRNHDDLQNISGGIASERYHLSQQQHDDLTGGGDASSQHNHSSIYYTKNELDNGELDDRYYTIQQLQSSGQSQVHWDNITNKPATYPPGSHQHTSADITDFTEAAQDSVAASLAATSTITPVYDDTNNRITFDLNSDSVTASHIAQGVDVSSKGFNADKVDGADLNDAGTSSTDLWSAQQIISYVTSNSAGTTDHAVLDKDLCTPPSSPNDGDRYIVCANASSGTATGDWAGHENEIAEWDGANSSWVFTTPDNGLRIWVDDENANYTWDANDTQWYKTGGGTIDHNALINLQGGDGSDEFFHLSQPEYAALRGGTTTDASQYHSHTTLIAPDGSLAVLVSNTDISVSKDTNFNENTVTGVPDPANDLDAVNKRTLDAKEHNTLQGLQGGDGNNEYYHLTSWEHAELAALCKNGELNRYLIQTDNTITLKVGNSLCVIFANGLFLDGCGITTFSANEPLIFSHDTQAQLDFGDYAKYSWYGIFAAPEGYLYTTYMYRVYDVPSANEIRLAYHDSPSSVLGATDVGWTEDILTKYNNRLVVLTGPARGTLLTGVSNTYGSNDAIVTVGEDLTNIHNDITGAWVLATPAVDLKPNFAYLGAVYRLDSYFMKTRVWNRRTIVDEALLAHSATASRTWYSLDCMPLCPPTAQAFDALVTQPGRRDFIAHFSTDGGNTICRGSFQVDNLNRTYNGCYACVTAEAVPLILNDPNTHYHFTHVFLQRATRLYTAGWHE